MLEIPPVEPLSEWVKYWRMFYSTKYGRSDDRRYTSLMADLCDAHDDASLGAALWSFFKWKDGAHTRWDKEIATITFSRWMELKSSSEVPRIWQNGVVYNVFLQHVQSEGAIPMIDQHAWRGYCHVSARAEREELDGNRQHGLLQYGEYRDWFEKQAQTGIPARHLDQALMAYGQYIKTSE